MMLENKIVQSRFINELGIDFEKYSDKRPDQLIKFLFHGTSRTDPSVIYES